MIFSTSCVLSTHRAWYFACGISVYHYYIGVSFILMSAVIINEFISLIFHNARSFESSH